jgi:hypothetical protein
LGAFPNGINRGDIKMTTPILVKHWLLIFALLSMILISSTSCISLKNYGKFVPDADVTAAINRAEINPDLNYYITGSDVYPRSILGLNKAYILDSDLWKKVDLKPEELREHTAHMLQRAVNCREVPLGFTILDDKGKPIGVWYSILVPEISIKMLGDQKVIIYPPHDRNYNCYDEIY